MGPSLCNVRFTSAHLSLRSSWELTAHRFQMGETSKWPHLNIGVGLECNDDSWTVRCGIVFPIPLEWLTSLHTVLKGSADLRGKSRQQHVVLDERLIISFRMTFSAWVPSEHQMLSLWSFRMKNHGRESMTSESSIGLK